MSFLREWFLDLDDTPDDYTDHAGESVVVNAGEDGLEFGTGGGSGPELSDDDPLADGTADPGVSDEASRSDHVHPATGGGGSGGELVTIDPGVVTVDDTGDDVVVTVVSSVWGLDSDGPYYDGDDVTAGDEAALLWDPDTCGYLLAPLVC